MMCDRFYIRIPFSIFLWCFRCTQRLDDLFHLHGEYQSICRQPPLTVIRAILSGQTGTSPAINRYAAKGSLHE